MQQTGSEAAAGFTCSAEPSWTHSVMAPTTSREEIMGRRQNVRTGIRRHDRLEKKGLGANSFAPNFSSENTTYNGDCRLGLLQPEHSVSVLLFRRL